MNYRLCTYHDERSDDAVLQLVERALLWMLVLGDEVLIARFLSESNGLLIEEAWSICFLEEEEARYLDYDVGE